MLVMEDVSETTRLISCFSRRKQPHNVGLLFEHQNYSNMLSSLIMIWRKDCFCKDCTRTRWNMFVVRPRRQAISSASIRNVQYHCRRSDISRVPISSYLTGPMSFALCRTLLQRILFLAPNRHLRPVAASKSVLIAVRQRL